MNLRLNLLRVAAALVTAIVLSGGSAYAQDAQSCQPGIIGAISGPHAARYQALIDALIPFAGDFYTELPAVVNQATYQTLLDTANAAAAGLVNGRVLITLPDGTVMIDTARDDNTVNPNSNSYQHFLDKTINENHNSRLAILGAQQFACGVGLETKFSTSTNQNEVYLALRIGDHLDSDGTVRISNRE
jgi:hypothetical protein